MLAGHLERLGFSRELQKHYVRASWLHRVGRGAFVRAHETPTWRGALCALQTQAALPVHVGGPSALALLGRAHYLALGDGGPLHLFAPTGTTLPAWFRAGDWSVEPRLIRTNLLPPKFGVETVGGAGELPVSASTAERAMLETLFLMPDAVAPETARESMEGLVDLRPKRVTALLAACRSVRVKRLFLMLADRAEHRWLSRVDLTSVDLGRGKRSIAGGGVYDPEYRLAVPAALLGHDVAGEGG